jgi:hypothetical protein
MENSVGPTLSAFTLPEGISFESIFSILFALVFIFWLIYTLIVIYHWMRHAPDTWVAVPSIALHLFVSGWLIFYATSGLN